MNFSKIVYVNTCVMLHIQSLSLLKAHESMETTVAYLDNKPGIHQTL
jgi:hypothetical protein